MLKQNCQNKQEAQWILENVALWNRDETINP